jgi:hypothetical protein
MSNHVDRHTKGNSEMLPHWQCHQWQQLDVPGDVQSYGQIKGNSRDAAALTMPTAESHGQTKWWRSCTVDNANSVQLSSGALVIYPFKWYLSAINEYFSIMYNTSCSLWVNCPALVHYSTINLVSHELTTNMKHIEWNPFIGPVTVSKPMLVMSRTMVRDGWVAVTCMDSKVSFPWSGLTS